MVIEVFWRYEICAYPSKLTFGGRCVYSTFAWTQTNGITVYSKHIKMGKDMQYLGTAVVVSDGVLGVNYPAYSKI
jgi:lipocalin